MALQKQIFSVPVSGGLDQKTDPFQVDNNFALKLENARFLKSKKISKRLGQSPMLTQSSDSLLASSTIEYIASDDSQINLVTTNGVYSYSDSYGEWKNVSGVKDYAKVNTDYILKSSLNQYNPDTDYSSAYNVMVTVFRERQEGNPYSLVAVEAVTIVTEDINTGLKQIRKFTVDPADYKTEFQKVKIIDTGATLRYALVYNSTLPVVGDKINVLILDQYLETQYTNTYALTGYVPTKCKLDIQLDSNHLYVTAMQQSTISIRKYDFILALVGFKTHTVTNFLGLANTVNGLGFSTFLDSTTLHIFYITAPIASLGTKVVGIGFDKSLNNTITESTSADYSTASSGLLNIAINKNVNTIICAVQVSTTGISASEYASEVKKFTATYTTTYTIAPVTNEMSTGYGARLEILSRPFIFNNMNYVVCKSVEPDQRTGIVYNLDERKSSAQFSPFALSASRVMTGARSTNSTNAVIYNNNLYTSCEKIYGSDNNNIANNDFIANQGIARVNINFNTTTESRTKVRVGETTYVTDGRTYCFDARGCYESGFDLSPYIYNIEAIATGSPNPNVSSKTFNYVAVYTFYNGKGEIEYSRPSSVKTITTLNSTTYIDIFVRGLSFSYKDSVESTISYKYSRFGIDVSLYRTENNGSIFHKVGSVRNNVSGGNVSFEDSISDTDLKNNELLYTDGGILKSDSTPNAKFSVSGGNRMFLGGLEEQDEIAYSKKQLFGETVSFSDLFRIRVSTGRNADKTPISALGYMDNKLIVFRENSIYFIQGDGPNELGVGSFSDPELISSDVGCVQPRSILNIPNGLLFKSKKGIYLLTRSLSTEYVGASVEDFNSYDVISSLVSDKFNEARFYISSNDCLVYNFLFNAWSVFKNQTTVDADIWNDLVVLVNNGKVQREIQSIYWDNQYTNFYSMKFTTAWLKLNVAQGFLRVFRLFILGTYKTQHTLKVKIYFNYNDSISEDYDLTYNNTEDPQYQFGVHLPIQKVESIKFEIYDYGHPAFTSGEGYELSNLQLEVGVKEGGFKLATTKQY